MLTNVKKKSKLVNEERLEVTLEEKKKKKALSRPESRFVLMHNCCNLNFLIIISQCIGCYIQPLIY